MTRAIALAMIAAVATSGCESAIRHPAITAGVVGATMGLGTCELSSGDTKPCLYAGAGAAALLGGVTALVLLFVGDDDTRAVLDNHLDEQAPAREPHPVRMLDPDAVPPPAPPSPKPEPAPAPAPAPDAAPASP